jgi:hypothetical protein
MAADVHLIDANAPVLDGRNAVLDPGRKHEISDVEPPLGS